jgi:predicted O-linked N-acetylglucosamine transferase (SPINDLY family)
LPRKIRIFITIWPPRFSYKGGWLDEAIAAFRQLLAVQPNFAEAHNSLGRALAEQGRLDEALAAYRRTLQIRPDYAEAHGNLLLSLHYAPEFDAQTMFEEHCLWGDVHAGPLAPFIQPNTNDRSPDRPLRGGYVSPDFREHSVAFFLENLLACHDPGQIEIFCYADMSRPDAVTVRLQQHAAHWRRITGLSDAQVAELIRIDRIDILVDLSGHTAHYRLLVFARKPAPVQVSWLGYRDTTGLKAMDYRLTDAHADPPGTTELWHTEQLVRLPDCAWCFRPSEHAPAVSPPPRLRAGHITFGCFNARPKITVPLLKFWADILLGVPGSRLVLENQSLRDISTQQRLRTVMAKAGISSNRIDLENPTPELADHLASYGRVDIALDTFPYHGTTTTCEALWMGVPVVSLSGKTHPSRVGVALLKNVGLPELVAPTPEDYVQRTVELATDLPRLDGLRSTLRQRMQASPLMDAPRFARHIEAAYRMMWHKWRK